jgi:hypothetical protein
MRMRMLYLRQQTKNDLIGEHLTIMVRALPSRRTGYDDAWLSAFVADTQRRIISLLNMCTPRTIRTVHTCSSKFLI